MNISYHVCDLCLERNSDNEDFKNEAIFVTAGETKENYRICLSCLSKFSEFIVKLKNK